MACYPEFLYEIAGYLCSDRDLSYNDNRTAASTVRSGGLKNFLQTQKIDEVFVVERRGLPASEMNRLFEVCTELEIGLSFIPQTYEMYVFQPEMMDLGGLPFIRLKSVSLSYAGRVSKRCMDVVFSLIAVPCLLLSALLTIIAVYSKISTG